MKININLGFLAILGIIFIAFKLAGIINWSWWIVLLPFYFRISLIAVICAAVGLYAYLIKK
jgi:hypothetical protein